MNIFCLKCKKKYAPQNLNTVIIGPYIKATCPFCSYVYEGKFTKFVAKQLGREPRIASIHDAARMQVLAEYIELNSSDYYKERGLRHGRKKVRDIRDRREPDTEGS